MTHAPAAESPVLQHFDGSLDESMQATLWTEWDVFRINDLPGADSLALSDADIGHFESTPVDWV